MELKVNDLKHLEENINRTCLTLWRREREMMNSLKLVGRPVHKGFKVYYDGLNRFNFIVGIFFPHKN